MQEFLPFLPLPHSQPKAALQPFDLAYPRGRKRVPLQSCPCKTLCQGRKCHNLLSSCPFWQPGTSKTGERANKWTNGHTQTNTHTHTHKQLMNGHEWTHKRMNTTPWQNGQTQISPAMIWSILISGCGLAYLLLFGEGNTCCIVIIINLVVARLQIRVFNLWDLY